MSGTTPAPGGAPETTDQWAERVLRRETAAGVPLRAATDSMLVGFARGFALDRDELTDLTRIAHVRATLAVEARLRAEGLS